MSPDFWEGKRVLLTGHTGFKGSWLSLWLQNLGAIVVGYSLKPPTDPSLFEMAKIARGMTSIVGDVRDLKHLQNIIHEQALEIVIHMAAQSMVRHSYADPVATYDTNVMGTVNTLEAVRNSSTVRAVIIVTSDKCYENKEWVWGYRENDPLGGRDIYSSSKGCAELITSAYRESYFSSAGSSGRKVAIASVRAGNVIGGGDWARDRIIPDTLNAFMQGQPVLLRYPHAIRPWQHVLEPLSGYLTLAEKLWEGTTDYAGGWNFGPNDEDARPVIWIVQQLAALWGNSASWELDTAAHPHEAHYLKLDCSRARSMLGWAPKLCLSTALEWVSEWYRAYSSKGDVRNVTESQINRYQNLRSA